MRTIFDLNTMYIVYAMVAIAIIYGTCQTIKFYRKEHLECPVCGNKWKPSLPKLLLSTNAAGAKVIRCPKCGEKSHVETKKDGE